MRYEGNIHIENNTLVIFLKAILKLQELFNIFVSRPNFITIKIALHPVHF